MNEAHKYTPTFEEMRTGDAESRKRAFDVFVAPKRSQMVRFAKNKLSGSVAKQGAEDAVQDALLSTWNNIPTMRENTNMAGYLNTAITSRAITVGREATAKQRRLKAEDINDIQNESIAANNGENASDRALYIDLINTLKDNMPEGFAETLIMHEVEGYDYKEIAEILNIPIGTVSSRLRRAKIHARKILEKSGD